MQHTIEEAFHPRQFGPLPDEIVDLAVPIFFPRGTIINRQGEKANQFFYVHKGHVRGTIVRSDGIEKVIAFAESGQFFAEVPFFQQCNHWYTGEAVEPTNVSSFSWDMIEKMNRTRPDFVLRLMQSLAHKVWMLSNQMMSLTFDHSEVRLARILVEILTRKPAGTRSLSITHQELSALMGTSRVMVTRLLNGWRTSGIVDLRKGTISVINQEALERIAAFGIE
ncbi:Crp/Fnr family transcriptional regulator [Peribacillus sp. B-H-3]|uniref:Crp/Fnr family transcriptional regulator n=1 Tax=Peribacillus sp. B-H-3 TaxID=3400420 RepID=UPI003B02A642